MNDSYSMFGIKTIFSDFTCCFSNRYTVQEKPIPLNTHKNPRTTVLILKLPWIELTIIAQQQINYREWPGEYSFNSNELNSNYFSGNHYDLLVDSSRSKYVFVKIDGIWSKSYCMAQFSIDFSILLPGVEFLPFEK